MPLAAGYGMRFIRRRDDDGGDSRSDGGEDADGNRNADADGDQDDRPNVSGSKHRPRQHVPHR